MDLRAGAICPRFASTLLIAAALSGSRALAIEASGDVSGAWTADLSPIIVTADCRVAANTSLTVGPGVRILLAPNASLVVQGTLFAFGSPEEPCTIGAAAPLLGPWRSIVVPPSGAAYFDHCAVWGGGAADPTELSGEFSVQGGLLGLRNCAVSDSASNGVYVRGGGLHVAGSRFARNGGDRPTDAALHIVYGSVTLGDGGSANCIEESPFGVYNENLVPVDARGIWWGSATGPQHADNLPGQGVPVSDDVLFGDFATVSPIAVSGDVNLDGQRDLQDVAALARLTAGIDESTPAQLATGDIVADGALDLQDAVALAQAILTVEP
jgi:hypothetical protein